VRKLGPSALFPLLRIVLVDFTLGYTDALIFGGSRSSPPVCSRTKGKATMSEKSGYEQAEEQILAYDISDECLETAAGSGGEQAGIYTLGSCTGYYSCPPSLT
jgi:hypothetical protein